jgi:hypothetical protein
MRQRRDDPAESAPDEPGISPGDPDGRGSDPDRGSRPLLGGYYWFPTPAPNGITWSIVTCRDLGCNSDAGHDADLWPRLMVPLAAAWGKDALILKRRLALSYTGLPRGRVTRPEKTFLVLHGKDSPVRGWEQMVISSFRLSGRRVKFIFDGHETQLPGHPDKFSSIFGPVH